LRIWIAIDGKYRTGKSACATHIAKPHAHPLKLFLNPAAPDMMALIVQLLNGSPAICGRRFMKRKLLVVLAAVASLVLFSSAAMAHHGVAGYDMSKTITLHGTVTKFEWSNPHVVVYVDAKNDKGEMQNWTIEFAAPIHMVRAGWNKNVMKTGDDIVIDTHPSRNGAPVGITSTITFILKVVVNGQALPGRSD
jgi:hypothetical protein